MTSEEHKVVLIFCLGSQNCLCNDSFILPLFFPSYFTSLLLITSGIPKIKQMILKYQTENTRGEYENIVFSIASLITHRSYHRPDAFSSPLLDDKIIMADLLEGGI